MGMFFLYLNTQEILTSFVALIKPIYDFLNQSDTYLSGQGVTIPSLQEKCKLYIRVALDSLAQRSCVSFDFMNTNRR